MVAGGRHARGPHEAWIAADPYKGGFRVLITGPQGFERTVVFALDDDPALIAERVRETMEPRAGTSGERHPAKAKDFCAGAFPIKPKDFKSKTAETQPFPSGDRAVTKQAYQFHQMSGLNFHVLPLLTRRIRGQRSAVATSNARLTARFLLD